MAKALKSQREDWDGPRDCRVCEGTGEVHDCHYSEKPCGSCGGSGAAGGVTTEPPTADVSCDECGTWFSVVGDDRGLFADGHAVCCPECRAVYMFSCDAEEDESEWTRREDWDGPRHLGKMVQCPVCAEAYPPDALLPAPPRRADDDEDATPRALDAVIWHHGMDRLHRPSGTVWRWDFRIVGWTHRDACVLPLGDGWLARPCGTTHPTESAAMEAALGAMEPTAARAVEEAAGWSRKDGE